MNLLDEQYTKAPFYGVLKMTESMRQKGQAVGRDHVRTLLRKMGLFAVYCKKNTSRRHPEHRIYPYLLQDVAIERPNPNKSEQNKPQKHGITEKIFLDS